MADLKGSEILSVLTQKPRSHRSRALNCFSIKPCALSRTSVSYNCGCPVKKRKKIEGKRESMELGQGRWNNFLFKKIIVPRVEARKQDQEAGSYAFEYKYVFNKITS